MSRKVRDLMRAGALLILLSTSYVGAQPASGNVNSSLAWPREEFSSQRYADPAADGLFVKEMHYHDAIQRGRALLAEELSLMTQRSALMMQENELLIQARKIRGEKISLLQSAKEPVAENLQELDRRLQMLNQEVALKDSEVQSQSVKIRAQTEKVQANQKLTEAIEAMMTDPGSEAPVDETQFIDALYELNRPVF